jgi:hypothetical protein
MTEHGDELNRVIRAGLRTLAGGLTQGALAQAYEGYKALYKIGAAALPQLRAAALESDRANVKRANEIRYVAGLVNLIRDIDEAEAARVSAELKLAGCAPALAATLDSICRFTLADYTRYEVRGMNVCEHKNLRAGRPVRRKLEAWLGNVAPRHLEGIERIYVLRQGDLDSLGSYTPVLGRISLVWDNPRPRWSPMSWVDDLLIESTLYHEIGHHAHRHKFGQDPEQEAEADRFAGKIASESRPLVHGIARAARRLFNPAASK